MPKPIREGMRDFGETWTNWAVFPATVSDDDILEEWPAAVGCAGPGMEFAHRPVIRRNQFRILVYQYCGLDV